MSNQAQPYANYGYPNMQPGFHQGPASHTEPSPSHDPYGQSVYQQYSQVRKAVTGRCIHQVSWPNSYILFNIFCSRYWKLKLNQDLTLPLFLQPFPNLSQLSAALGGLSGVPELEVEALRPVNLLQERNLLPPRPLEAPEPNLSPELNKVNCSPQ